MPDLDLIEQLGELLGRPLEQLPEARFERRAQAEYAWEGSNQDRITKNAYSLSEDGKVSGLFLRPGTGPILFDFPFHRFSMIRYLYLNQVELIDFLFLAELTSLKILYLSKNQIIDCYFLLRLRELEILDLSGNQIADCSFLSELKGLKALNLYDNQITDCYFFSDLEELKILNLGKNQITDCSFLSELKELTTLELNCNQIANCLFLSKLGKLKTLDLSRNFIADWHFSLELKGLTSLDLGGNQIVDCSFFLDLKELKNLVLWGNEIANPYFLAELKELENLDLWKTQIKSTYFLSELKKLKALDLGENQIREIPSWLAKGQLAIKIDQKYSRDCINLHGNPIEEPPLEIVSQGNEAILNYYDQLAIQGQDYLYEAKMLIVGEGEAGKTTLAHKIPEPDCPLPHVDDRTRGISVQTHTFSCRNQDPFNSSESRNFNLNIWDFGGQEIYHYTHRFFLSKRSLYVLVADNRKDDTDFNYWLNIIERFAGNSPLIIVLNEKGDIQRSLNQADLKGRYAESIKDIRSVNFKTQEEPDLAKKQQRLKAINNLIHQIEHCAQSLPHIGEAVPARWVDVRRAIEQDPRNHIYRQQFDEICQGQAITTRADVDTLLGYFHDLGILLHFAENPLLRHHVILKPTWATNAVYRIFDNDAIKAKAGRFSRQDCGFIWQDDEYRPMHDVLIELMKNFRLVYEIDQTGELVAPQLLPPNTPTYPWDDSHNSHMQLRYDTFMPKGIFWQLAVTLYRYIPNHDWVWRNGMVIQRGNTWAEIKEDLNLRRISLRFSGPSIAEFRAVIVDELDAISQSYHQLQYDKMIPCNCSYCLERSEPHFFRYTRLKTRQESGKKPTIECEISEEDVSLRSLLEGFDVETIVKTLPDKTGPEPTPPEASAPPTMQTIKIFLASSAELKADREQFEIFINRKNKALVKTGIFLELVIWEDFLAALSKTRSQDEYNQAIQTCDMFVILAYTKVGQYTEEEFRVALETFKDSDKPLIFTYFKDAAINMSRITPEIMTLLNFKQNLSDMGHFYQNYADSTDLKHQFGEQLTKCLPKLTGIDP